MHKKYFLRFGEFDNRVETSIASFDDSTTWVVVWELYGPLLVN